MSYPDLNQFRRSEHVFIVLGISSAWQFFAATCGFPSIGDRHGLHPSSRHHRQNSSSLRQQPGPKRAASALLYMIGRQKWRRALLLMDDHLLKDIGITRERALLEARKWFWQD
jgi:uncharacterized protein YjiS (DUF1127 family)